MSLRAERSNLPLCVSVHQHPVLQMPGDSPRQHNQVNLALDQIQLSGLGEAIALRVSERFD